MFKVIVDPEKIVFNGCIPSKPDPRDYQYRDARPSLFTAAAVKQELPKKFHLKRRELHDQSIVGACVGFACANDSEADQITLGREYDMSKLYLYSNCKKIDGNTQEGTEIKLGFQVMKDIGICRESLYPFSEKREDMEEYKKVKFPPCPKAADADASLHKLNAYSKVDVKVEDLKTAIYNQNGAVGGVNVTDTFIHHQNGIVGRVGGFFRGSHAIHFTGWDDDEVGEFDYRKVFPEDPDATVVKYRGFVYFENSWKDSEGNWWGDPKNPGYGKIPYDLIYTETKPFVFDLVHEIWCGLPTVDPNSKYHPDYHKLLPGNNTFPTKQLEVKMKVGSDKLTVNGKPQTLSVKPTIVNNTTMVPLRAISQILGADVEYIHVGQQINITMTHEMLDKAIDKVK